MNNTPSVSAENIVKVFGHGASLVRALDNVSVDIQKGEFFTLLGPSGCGKTTLLRLIAGFDTPSEGRIVLDGQEVTDLPPNHRPVNTVFQSYALFPHLSVRDNVTFGLKMQGRPKSEILETGHDMLGLVKLESMGDRSISQLSGGQQQRVALARALAPRPKVLLLDEPLSALDLKLRQEMQVELKRLQKQTGITFIFVTHDQEEALTMSDRIAVMHDGKIQQIGSPREIYTAPVNRFVAGFIGETNFLPVQKSSAGIRLGCGELVEAGGEGNLLTIRPEHIKLLKAEDPQAMAATVTELQYFGTDMHVYLTLKDGASLIARAPLSPSGFTDIERNQSVGIGFVPGAARLIGE